MTFTYFIYLFTFIFDGLPLMKNVITPLVKNMLISLGVTAVMPATDAAIQKKLLGSGHHL